MGTRIFLLAVVVAALPLPAARAEQPASAEAVRPMAYRREGNYHAHNGFFGASAGIGGGATSDGRFAVAPAFGVRLSGFEVEQRILADVDLRFTGSPALAAHNLEGEFKGAGGGGLRFQLGRVFGDEGCNFSLSGGFEAEYLTPGAPGSAIGRGDGVRVMPGLICSRGTRTLLVNGYVGAGSEHIFGGRGMIADVGTVARVFLDRDLFLTADAAVSRNLGEGTHRVDGRLSADVRVGGSVYVSADARVSGRVDSGRGEAASPAAVVVGGLSATAAF
jgi:hypothetical protein